MSSWTFACRSAVFNPDGKVLRGDNIIVPQEVLEDIQDLERDVYRFTVKSTAAGSRSVCCRVGEFSPGSPQCVYLPAWMIQNLYLNEAHDEVEVQLLESVVDTAERIVVQPHDSIFLTLDDHKAVLERALGDFGALTAGTSISVHHEGEDYSLSVVALDPPHQFVSMVDTDVAVEFLPPLDYVEEKPSDWPEAEQWPLGTGVFIKEEIRADPKVYVLSDGRRVSLTPAPAPAPARERGAFVPFSGKGHRLGN